MKVMLLDDELSFLEDMERGLKPTGYECFPFPNATDALEAYSQDSFDVVITDFLMPEMNGIEVLKAIKEMNPDASVIILTGYVDIDNAIAAVNNGAYAFFRKPLDFPELIRTLQKLEEKIQGVWQKDVDMRRFLDEYSRLRTAYESLQGVVREMGGNRQEDPR
jgi:two-component system, NtrC family, C4-dicarboxylate transport response regulator DctD